MSDLTMNIAADQLELLSALNKDLRSLSDVPAFLTINAAFIDKAVALKPSQINAAALAPHTTIRKEFLGKLKPQGNPQLEALVAAFQSDLRKLNNIKPSALQSTGEVDEVLGTDPCIGIDQGSVTPALEFEGYEVTPAAEQRASEAPIVESADVGIDDEEDAEELDSKDDEDYKSDTELDETEEAEDDALDSGYEADEDESDKEKENENENEVEREAAEDNALDSGYEADEDESEEEENEEEEEEDYDDQEEDGEEEEPNEEEEESEQNTLNADNEEGEDNGPEADAANGPSLDNGDDEDNDDGDDDELEEEEEDVAEVEVDANAGADAAPVAEGPTAEKLPALKPSVTKELADENSEETSCVKINATPFSPHTVALLAKSFNWLNPHNPQPTQKRVVEEGPESKAAVRIAQLPRATAAAA